MKSEWSPMRWPAAWKDPAALGLLENSPVNCLLAEDLAPEMRARAGAAGLRVGLPDNVQVVSGLWPGIKLSRAGGDRVTAGPTGVPWVDSNGWRVRLAAALHPAQEVWVDAAPKEPRLSPGAYLTAMADAAAAGGKWILTLDDKLAAGVAARQSQALETWRAMSHAVAYFQGHTVWNSYTPEAVVGVMSDFSGAFSGELLNLMGRGNMQYRVIPKDRIAPESFARLRAVMYADASGPGEDVRARVMSFVESGGMLITGPAWGTPKGGPAGRTHPRYAPASVGRGSVAVAAKPFSDPYEVANDSAVLVSHRNELLRFWNGGALSSYLAAKKDARQAVLQIVFYAGRSTDDATVRVAGRYRSARLSTIEAPELHPIHLEVQDNAVEIHLPGISHFAAVELSE